MPQPTVSDVVLAELECGRLGSREEFAGRDPFRVLVLGNIDKTCRRLLKSIEEHEGASAEDPKVYKNLLRFCLATRLTGAHLCEGWLFDAELKHLGLVDLIKSYADRIKEVLAKLKSITIPNPDAANYVGSITKRLACAEALLKNGMRDVYDEMVLTALSDDEQGYKRNLPARCCTGDWFLSNEEIRTLDTTPIGFLRTAYSWLLFRLANLCCELRLEHGPFAEAINGHLEIAKSTRQATDGVLNIMRGVCDDSLDELALKFERRLREHLEWFSANVVNPLQEMHDQIPGDLEPDEIEAGFGGAAKHCLEEVRGRALTGLMEIEAFSRQIETVCGERRLSVLITSSRDENGVSVWVGEGLELGVFGQSHDRREAIELVAKAAEDECDHIGVPGKALPLPAFPEDFATFDMLTGELDSSGIDSRFKSLSARLRSEEESTSL